MRLALIGLAGGVLLLLAWLSTFTVDPSEFVYVTEFGRPIASYDGSLTETDAGLHFRWPWPVQAVRRVDRRLQYADLPSIEVLTRGGGDGADKTAGSGVDKTLTVEAYVCWRIADKDALDTFIRRLDSIERARTILSQRVNSQLGAMIPQKAMDDLISTEMVRADGPGGEMITKVDQEMARLRQLLLDALRKPIRDEYGIDLVDIRLRRFNHPGKVRSSIFARIISERRQISARYKSEGEKAADAIRSINKAKIELLNTQVAKVEKLAKAEAEVEAEGIRKLAYLKDEQFFQFWNELEQMRAVFGNSRTRLLLSTEHPLLRFLRNPALLDPEAPKKEQP